MYIIRSFVEKINEKFYEVCLRIQMKDKRGLFLLPDSQAGEELLLMSMERSSTKNVNKPLNSFTSYILSPPEKNVIMPSLTILVDNNINNPVIIRLFGRYI